MRIDYTNKVFAFHEIFIYLHKDYKSTVCINTSIYLFFNINLTDYEDLKETVE